MAAAGMLVAGCGGGGEPSADGDPVPTAMTSAAAGAGAAVEPVQTTEADWAPVADALGRPGKLMAATVYRVGFPRADLRVRSEGVPIAPGLSLGSYAAFAKYPDGSSLVVGDLVVTEAELAKVTDALQEKGIAQTAVHKHLLAQTPAIWWTHFHARGEAAQIAGQLRAVLDRTGTPAAKPPAADTPLDLDTEGIDAALGRSGTGEGGIYKFSIARQDTISDDGLVMPPAMGVSTVLNFQPTGGGRAAINGDFAMTADEVQDVIAALRGHKIRVVSVHNHALDDSPRLIYTHFWAEADAVDLARGLRAALDATDVEPVG